jgi:hypothetical protein
MSGPQMAKLPQHSPARSSKEFFNSIGASGRTHWQLEAVWGVRGPFKKQQFNQRAECFPHLELIALF